MYKLKKKTPHVIYQLKYASRRTAVIRASEQKSGEGSVSRGVWRAAKRRGGESQWFVLRCVLSGVNYQIAPTRVTERPVQVSALPRPDVAECYEVVIGSAAEGC